MPRLPSELDRTESQLSSDASRSAAMHPRRERVFRRDVVERIAILVFALAMGALFVVAGGIALR